jgi:hypothetical protein
MPTLILDAGDPGAPRAAAAAAARLPAGAPVVALLHGYRYAPGRRGHCPGESLYAEDGWPARLALGEALCIGFCWNARGTIWQAWRASAQAGAALARVMAAAGRPVDAVAHSLGARVALVAAGLAPAGAAGRLILLAAAAFRGEAQAVLSTPGGAAAEIFNVTSRENDVFDALLAAAIRRRPGPALGAGLGEWRRNWVDIAIDDAETRAALGRLGFPIPAPKRAVCHWSGYLRPGLFPFYAELLRERALLPLPLIAAMLPEPGPAPGYAGRPALSAVGGRVL